MSVLVLGVGNILLMDEGAGIRVVEELERKYCFQADVEIVDGGTSGLELLSYLQNKSDLILIDAVKGGHPPGTVFKIEGDDVPVRFSAGISPHQLGISDLLASARLTGDLPGNIVLFGIEPGCLDTGLGFSKEVKNNLHQLVECVLQKLDGLGYKTTPRPEGEWTEKSFWNQG